VPTGVLPKSFKLGTSVVHTDKNAEHGGAKFGSEGNVEQVNIRGHVLWIHGLSRLQQQVIAIFDIYVSMSSAITDIVVENTKSSLQ